MIRKILLIALVTLVLLPGCASLPKAKPWTKGEKILLVASILAAGADYYTTERCLDRGGSEMNPLIGEHPTDTQLFLKGWGGYAGLIIITHYSGKWRPVFLGGLIVLNTGFAIHNSRLD